MKHLSLIFLFVFLAACSRETTPRDFTPAKKEMAPAANDITLKLRLREFGETPPALAWKGEKSTSEFFAQAETLYRLGKTLGDNDLKAKSIRWLDKFYSSNKIPRVSFPEAPFAGLAASQTRDQVTEALNEVLGDIEIARPLISDHILSMRNDPVPLNMSLEDMLSRAEDFSDRIVLALPKMGLSKVIEDGLSTELPKTTGPMFAKTREYLVRFNATRTLSQAIALVDEAVAGFEITLSPELQKSMKQGRNLAKNIDAMSDAQGALTVLVDVWRMLTPAEREANMKPVNEELYNFLRKQDSEELDCLRTPGCLGGPIDGVVKKVFILPKIKKYGVEQLKKDMNGKTRDYVIASIQTFAQGFVAEIGKTFVQNIDAAIVDKAGRIAGVRDNYDAYVKRIIGTWSQKILPTSQGSLVGFEPLTVQVHIERKEDLVLSPQEVSETMTGDLVGASMAVQSLYLQEKEMNQETGRATTLSILNKLVSMTGYRNGAGHVVPALLAPVTHSEPILDILDFNKTKGADASFRVPDTFKLYDAFHLNGALSYERNFSAKSLASQLHGLNRFIEQTADWRKTRFDQFLGDIKAQDVTTDAYDEALQQPLFPKDMLFALNLGASAVLFQDITKNATPVFLYTLEGPVMWANEYGTSANTAVMAGVLDIKKGQRADQMSGHDVADLILAITEFLSVSEGVEKTKSPILLEKAEGEDERPLDTLLQGRKDLKLLTIALSNMLSHHLVSTTDSLVMPHFDYVAKKGASEGYQLKDQAIAIRALLASYRLTGIEAYLWSAQNIYFAMNKKMFDIKKEFYISKGATDVDFTEILSTVEALSELKPYLEGSSQAQLHRVLQPWLDSLKLLP